MNRRLVKNMAPLLVVASAASLVASWSAHGAIESRNILKTFFETGDVPTADQFGNLIDSFIHLTDDGLTLTGIGAVPDGSPQGAALRVGANIGINETLPDVHLGAWSDASLPPHPGMNSMFSGSSGFLPLRYESAGGLAHYGFLQIDMEVDPGVAPGPGIFVTQWVWDSTPGATLTTFAVPEPTAAALLIVSVPMLLWWRR